MADLDDAMRFAPSSRWRDDRVPVNIIDKPEHSDFAFGALVNRSLLIVAVSTDGAAPVFGQAIRTKIKRCAGRVGEKNWAQAAADWRPAIQARELPFALRRSFWELFTGKGDGRASARARRAGRAELFSAARPDRRRP